MPPYLALFLATGLAAVAWITWREAREDGADEQAEGDWPAIPRGFGGVAHHQHIRTGG